MKPPPPPPPPTTTTTTPPPHSTPSAPPQVKPPCRRRRLHRYIAASRAPTVHDMEGVPDEIPPADPYEAYQEEVRKISDTLGVLPETILCYLPDAIRQNPIGDHEPVTDDEGNETGAPSRISSLGVLMPQLSLKDAQEIKRMINNAEKFKVPSNKGKENSQNHGWCQGVPFLVKNLDHLEAKMKEYKILDELSSDISALSSTISDRVQNILKNPRYGHMMGSTQSVIEDQGRACHECKVHLVLSKYWRDDPDVSDVLGRYGPHEAILKLLPEVHKYIYVGPGKFDPCYKHRHNSDEEKKGTEDALLEAMEDLMYKSPTFHKSTTTEQQSCCLLKSEGNYEQQLELISAREKLNFTFLTVVSDLESVTLCLKELCNDPSLIGNTGSGPEWILPKDCETSDFEEEWSPTRDFDPEDSIE
ncbi:hypothetical protein ACP4OV_026436 [Aristida adscensionis]